MTYKEMLNEYMILIYNEPVPQHWSEAQCEYVFSMLEEDLDYLEEKI